MERQARLQFDGDFLAVFGKLIRICDATNQFGQISWLEEEQALVNVGNDATCSELEHFSRIQRDGVSGVPCNDKSIFWSRCRCFDGRNCNRSCQNSGHGQAFKRQWKIHVQSPSRII